MNAYQIQVEIGLYGGSESSVVLDRDQFCPSGQIPDRVYCEDMNLLILGGIGIRLPHGWTRDLVETISLRVIC
jgi:hypothetical protein